MVELMELNTTQVIDYLVQEQMELRGLSKKLAKQLVLNALTYNLVSAEIHNQIGFLLGEEEEL